MTASSGSRASCWNRRPATAPRCCASWPRSPSSDRSRAASTRHCPTAGRTAAKPASGPSAPREAEERAMRTKLSPSALLLLSLLGALTALPARAGDAQGLLYGRVTSRTGTVYEGRLRWGKEEASWIDLFNSAKAENPWREAAGHDRTPKRVEVLGVQLPFAS